MIRSVPLVLACAGSPGVGVDAFDGLAAVDARPAPDPAEAVDAAAAGEVRPAADTRPTADARAAIDARAAEDARAAGDARAAADGRPPADQAGDAPAVSPVRSCNGRTVAADPGNVSAVLAQARGAEVIVELAPGTYPQFSPSGIACLELRCTAPAIVGGAPNPDGCRITRSINVLRVRTFIARSLVFVNDNTVSGTPADYGIALYEGTEFVRIAGNAFNGNMNHDISTKNTVTYAEVLDNLFVRCMRHCFEVGQNGNIPSRPSTGEVAIVRGNLFLAPRRNAITQRYNRTLVVEGNEFRDVGGQTVENWPFWAPYTGELNRVPQPPLRTEVIGNRLVGRNRFVFEGRGVQDDVVLIKGNTGTASCRRVPMDPGTAAAHSNEETTEPPKLDPASDLPCPAQ